MNSTLQIAEKVDSVLAESKEKSCSFLSSFHYGGIYKMNIDDAKGKAQLYLIDHLSMLKEKEYPYNYNEISEVIDKLASIFYGEDYEEEEETVSQEDYDELENFYEDLKDEAGYFRDTISDYLKELEEFEKLTPEKIKEIIRKAKLECSNFDWYC